MKPADTFGHVKRMLEKEHSLDLEHIPLTEDPSGKTVCPESKTVAQAKLSNGHMLYMKIDDSKLGVHESSGIEVKKSITKDGSIVSQHIETVLNSSGFRPGMLPLRSMKMQWTLDEFNLMDSQFIYKIKAPEKDKGGICKTAVLDSSSVDNFQSYMRNFDFQVMRVAFLYGRFQDDKSAKVEFIYEPPQETTERSFELPEDSQGDLVDGIASMLGLTKVGWIFAHPPREKGFFFSGTELMFAAEQQLESAQGINDTSFVTVSVTVNEEGLTDISAYQVSKQCMEMVAEGVLDLAPNPGFLAVNSTFTVEAEGKPVKEVDVQFFVLPVPIDQFESDMLISKFPRTNRMDTLQTREDIKIQLTKSGKEGWTFIQLLADFQLLLYLCQFLCVKDDLPIVCRSIVDREVPLEEGYALLIRSIADIE